MGNKVEREITAQNQFTDWIHPEGYVQGSKSGHLALSVSGADWAATVVLQRSFDRGVTPHDVKEYTANEEVLIEDRTDDIMYRVGVKTGGYTSGTINVLLSR